MQRTIKKKNLVIYGLEESQKHIEALEKSLIQNIDESHIEMVRGLGRQTDRINPILVSFDS